MSYASKIFIICTTSSYKNHYPAIDILQSISRVMSSIATKEHKNAAGRLKNVLATYNDICCNFNVSCCNL